MKSLLTAVAILGLLSGPSFAAADCSKRLSKIDEAIKTAKISDEDMKKVQDLRAKADEFNKAGKADDCKKSAKEALTLLGVKKAKSQ